MPALTPEQIKRRIEERVKKASASVSATDPTEKGGASIPTDPKASKEKQNLPADKTNVSNEGTKLEDKDTKPVSTGKNVPPAADGEAADKVTKVASADRISAAKERLAKLNISGIKTAADKGTDGDEKKTTEVKKTAGNQPEDEISLDYDAMLKLASTIVATEEGMDVVLPLLRRQIGRERAAEMIKAASEEYNQALQAEYEAMEFVKYAAEQEAAQAAFIQEILDSAETPEQAERLIKTATAHQMNTADLAEWEKMAYAQGADDAAMMMAAEEEGGDPALAGAEAPSIDQILMLLEAAVANGEIDEETAVALAEELIGGAEGGMGGEELPPEEAVKAASTSLVNDVKALYEKFNTAKN
jgi:hypothetical protein